MKSGFIYAIRCGEYVKIGFATDPYKRRSQIGISTPFDLDLLGYSKGTRADEAAIHAQLAAHRVRGEWFWYRADVAAFVGQMEVPVTDRDRRFGKRSPEVVANIKEGARLANLRRQGFPLPKLTERAAQ